MNQSEKYLSAGDIIRLSLVTVLSVWLLVFSVPATLSSGESGRGLMSLSVLPAAPAPPTWTMVGEAPPPHPAASPAHTANLISGVSGAK